MNTNFDILENCILFQGLNKKEILDSLHKLDYVETTYSKGSIIADEDDDCHSIGIVLSGLLEVQKIHASGKVVTLTQLRPGEIFGEAIVFSKQRNYPATITAAQETSVLFIAKDAIIQLCSISPMILTNFMELLSSRILMLNKKVKVLSLETIRQKLCSLFLEESKKQKSLIIKLSMSRSNLAEQMGIQRPSLSRELIKMKNEGLINFHKGSIEIKDLAALKEYLE
ncbi:Crp/Fnr family transcriptional regulator [Bacillota bacterium LX-D]|nr:Crp/Fnr family transcriptional regulator [Bacillota bacterium LX-D]